MQSIFSDRSKTLKKSFIKEMLQLAQQRDVISFAGGLPNSSMFPLAELGRIAEQVLGKYGHTALQYNMTEGFYPLRQLIAEIYNYRFDFKATAENILITSGAQQGIDLLGRLFIDPGDHVLIEEPSYVGAIESFATYGAQQLPIPLEDDGPDLSILKKSLQKHHPKFFYTVPTFQNPSGVTWSLEKRKKVVNLLKEHNVIIAEDDPYRQLRFTGEEIMPITSLADGNAIFFGSCSKIIAPGLRIGNIFAPEPAIEKMSTFKQAADVHSSILSQIVIYEYLTNYDCQAYVQKTQVVYGQKRTAMLTAMAKYFPAEVSYSVPEGGMFIWAQLPKDESAMDLFHEAVAQKVAFVPGDPFFVNDGGKNCFRLSYCNATEEDIDKGIKILGSVISKRLHKTPGNEEKRYALA